jgi:DNA-binding NarL/FixJ family response regulator
MAKRVLIADDSANMRYVIRALLANLADVEICGEAGDGLDAVKQIIKLEPDLVLLDLSMPRMNGAEVASVVKHNIPKVLIVLFTMYSENFGQSLKSAVNVDVGISKPDGMRQLVESVKGLKLRLQRRPFFSMQPRLSILAPRYRLFSPDRTRKEGLHTGDGIHGC